MAMDNLDSIVLVEYDPRWAQRYEEERRWLLQTLGGLDPCIEHIGSTAVPDLCAKPTIDIMVGLEQIDDLDDLCERLRPLDYIFQEKDNAGRLFFRKGKTRTHHLHIVVYQGLEWQRHIRFRDRLREDARLCDEYAQLKRHLALQHRDDRSAYVLGKSDFIRSKERD